MASTYLLERWTPGQSAWFEYHCWEDASSSDVTAWLRSHQRVTIVSGPTFDGEPDDGTTSQEERFDAGEPNLYRVRFADGLEWDVFEDELMTSERGFYRPPPPSTGDGA